MAAHKALHGRLAILCVLCTAMAACNGVEDLSAPATRPAAPSYRVAVDNDFLILHQGERASVRVRALSQTSLAMSWHAEDEAIASVDARGMITAKSIGSTTVTVGADGVSTDVVVTVLPASDEDVRHAHLR